MLHSDTVWRRKGRGLVGDGSDAEMSMRAGEQIWRLRGAVRWEIKPKATVRWEIKQKDHGNIVF